jgi:hypothetical protein
MVEIVLILNLYLMHPEIKATVSPHRKIEAVVTVSRVVCPPPVSVQSGHVDTEMREHPYVSPSRRSQGAPWKHEYG